MALHSAASFCPVTVGQKTFQIEEEVKSTLSAPEQ